MDEMTLQTFGSLVGNLGFPVVLTVYLLIRFEKELSKLTSTVENLKNSLDKE